MLWENKPWSVNAASWFPSVMPWPTRCTSLSRPALRYGPAGDSAPRLRLKASGMAERFPSGPASAPLSYTKLSNDIHGSLVICPRLFPRISQVPQIGPEPSRGAKRRKRTLDGEDRWVWQRLRVWENDCFGEVSELRPWAETTRRSPGAVYPALPMKFGPAQRTLDGAACRRIYLVRAR